MNTVKSLQKFFLILKKTRAAQSTIQNITKDQKTLHQFVIFNPLKVPWNWIAFYQNSCYITWLLYQLIRGDTGRLANEVFTWNPIVSSKQKLNGLKITNWHVIKELIKNFLTFIKAYFQKILTCPRMKLCNF